MEELVHIIILDSVWSFRSALEFEAKEWEFLLTDRDNAVNLELSWAFDSDCIVLVRPGKFNYQMSGFLKGREL